MSMPDPNTPQEAPAAPLGALEYFNDAVGTVYADSLGEAVAQVVTMLQAPEKAYGALQARGTAASTRFIGLAVHAEQAAP